MTHLRQLMIEELQRRNFAPGTIRAYVHGVEHFSQYFHRRPDRLRPEHIRQYQAMLFSKLKLEPNTVIQRLAALRFFYIKVLKKNWSIAETPYPRKVIRLPEILSPEEVGRLIDAAHSPFHRAMLMTLYGTGARRAEAAHLKIEDIDSRRMVVHIHGGKGNRDRDVMLSPRLLDGLRDYGRTLKRKPRVWLFPGNAWHTWNRPVTTKVLWTACRSAAERRRASLLPICFQLLTLAREQAPPAKAVSPTQQDSTWRCPLCGGSMRIVERISAAQLLPRSPPQALRCAT